MKLIAVVIGICMLLSSTIVGCAEPDNPEEVSGLVVTMEIPWESVYTSDPLYIVIRLSDRAYDTAIYQKMLGLEANSSKLKPSIPKEAFASLDLNLLRYEDGRWLSVLSAKDWKAEEIWFISDTDNLPSFPVATGEWLVPSEVVNLVPGEYRLMLSADSINLGERWITFKVEDPLCDQAQATHLARVAQAAYFTENYAQARDYARQSLAIERPFTPDCVDTHLILASAQICLSELTEAKSTLSHLLAALPSANDEVAMMVKQLILMLETWQQYLDNSN